MRVIQEQIFGPVVSVTTFKDEDAALEIALSRQLIAEFSSRLWQRQEESQPVIELVGDRVLMTPGGVLLILFQPKV